MYHEELTMEGYANFDGSAHDNEQDHHANPEEGSDYQHQAHQNGKLDNHAYVRYDSQHQVAQTEHCACDDERKRSMRKVEGLK